MVPHINLFFRQRNREYFGTFIYGKSVFHLYRCIYIIYFAMSTQKGQPENVMDITRIGFFLSLIVSQRIGKLTYLFITAEDLSRVQSFDKESNILKKLGFLYGFAQMDNLFDDVF